MSQHRRRRTRPGTPMQHGQFRGTPMWVSPSARQYDFVRSFLRLRSLVRTLFRCSRNNRGKTDKRKKSNDGGGLTRVGTALTRAFGSFSNFVVNGAVSEVGRAPVMSV